MFETTFFTQMFENDFFPLDMSDLFRNTFTANFFHYTETDEGLKVSIDLPGVKPEDLKLSMDRSLVILEYTRSDNETKPVQSTRKSFNLHMLNDSYDLSTPDARLVNGVLILKFSRLTNQESVKQIKVYSE